MQNEIRQVQTADELLLPHGIADYTFVPESEGGLLGKGKFSAVYIACKGEQQVNIVDLETPRKLTSTLVCDQAHAATFASSPHR